MPQTDLKIIKKGGELPAWPELEQCGHINPETWQVALIEDGTEEGHAVVGLRFELLPGPGTEDMGGVVVGQTTLRMFIGILAAAKGAFPEEFEGGIFAEFMEPTINIAAAELGRKGAEARLAGMTDDEQAEHMARMREARWPKGGGA